VALTLCVTLHGLATVTTRRLAPNSRVIKWSRPPPKQAAGVTGKPLVAQTGNHDSVNNSLYVVPCVIFDRSGCHRRIVLDS